MMTKATIQIGTLHPGKFLGVVMSFLTAVCIPTAEAERNLMITAGVGSAVGVNHASSGATTESYFSTDINLRVRALYVLGLEFGYAPTDYNVDAGGLNFAGSLKLSALLYFVPTRVVSAYFKGGIEGDDFGALFTGDQPSNAYHVGGGIDVDVTDNWVIGLEYLMLIPGVSSVESHLAGRAETELPRIQAALARGETLESLGVSEPEVGDYISGGNFRLSVTARYYF